MSRMSEVVDLVSEWVDAHVVDLSVWQSFADQIISSDFIPHQFLWGDHASGSLCAIARSCDTVQTTIILVQVPSDQGFLVCLATQIEDKWTLVELSNPVWLDQRNVGLSALRFVRASRAVQADDAIKSVDWEVSGNVWTTKLEKDDSVNLVTLNFKPGSDRFVESKIAANADQYPLEILKKS